MIEITPIMPASNEIQYPFLDENKELKRIDTRPSPASPYTAGNVFGDCPLDYPIPFGNFEDAYEPGSRAVGFAITRSGDTFHIPDPAYYYSELVSQLLGAARTEIRNEEALVGYYYFDVTECLLETSGGGLHYDGTSNQPDEIKALVSNVFPTLYVIENNTGSQVPHVGNNEIDPTKIDPSLLWTASPREITVHQGLTLHGAPICPNEKESVRRLASLTTLKDVVDTVVLTRIMIDDQYFTVCDAMKLISK